MPNYKGHIAGGAVAYIFVLFCIHTWLCPSLSLAVELLIFTVAGALFPDVDIKSKGQKLFYRVTGLLMIMLLVQEQYASCAFLALAALLPLLVNHRGIFHQWWFILSCSATAAVYARLYVVEYASLISIQIFFFTLGALSHLWLDFGPKKLFRL